MIKLGSMVRDSITGTRGIATKRMEVLHGTTCVCVESSAQDGAKPVEPSWFDEPRLQTVQDEAGGEDSSSP